ncbi:Disease resistance protein [Acorus gramineus]|uniref:Disease resistance protein n=1 Tax=Acorus gramineus TaxID=55184 RepID=A0AAV9AAA8_ACOGR|nr:Disease resistance protein [Acorus gramineus]
MTAPTATSAESMVKKVKLGQSKALIPTDTAAAVVNPRLKVVEQIPGPSVEGLMMDEILKLLSDDRIRKIGIWGMGGVGKTTLVRTLNNKLEDSSSPQLFDIVIWITVSKGTDVKTIQYRLVERLKMSTSMTESTEGRAIRLCERLKKEKKILLILDDVWEKIDLDKVGIPHGDAHPGCKIILTTRSFDVCREMETDKEMKVNVLSEEDAWKMFSKSAGDVVELKEIKSHAKDVSKECGGLPLALITVGKAMREKERPELWKNALYELRRSAPDIRVVEREVFLPLKLSYDSLQVENLIDSCMLERGDKEEEVKMHDVVRDVAIWIASSSEPEFETFARPGTGLTNFPKESMKESLRRVSLMNNEIEKLPPDRLMTNSKLLSFLLQGNPLRDIPEELFVGLRALRVLNLSSTCLKKLPLSLGSLGDLRALILAGCHYLEKLPHLGELKKLLLLDVRNTRIRELSHSLRSLGDLRALFLGDCVYLEKLPHLGEFKKLAVLDLNGTDIRELPDGMEELCNLRQLNLSYTDKLVNIQAGVFARLSRLEELEMQHSAYKWDVSGPQSMGRATFNELGSLMHLHLLYIDLENVACLSLDLSWLKKLKKFRICVGGQGPSILYTITNNERVVELCSIDLSGEAHFDELLANASALLLRDCRGIRSICELVESGTRAFIGLKSLAIWLCKEMTCVIKGVLVQESILPNLEELNLASLQNLEYIVEGMIPDGESLTKLRTIDVTRCDALQCLFTSALLPHVQSLEEINLSYCSGMSVLIPTEVNVADFSKVRVLYLEQLPNLEAVSKNPLAWPSLEHLTVDDCPKLKNVIRIDNQNPIREIEGDAEWSLICPGYTT